MTKRNYFFDNAKFILMAIVVFGHLLKSYIHESEEIYALYKTIYTFHMPAFILVSGFFAKGFYKKGYLSKITKKLILPYLIFQTIYTVFYYFLYSKSDFKMDLLDPQWAMWFLISLFCWNLMLLVFAKLKPALGIGIAVLAALLIGYADTVSNYLSLSRTFVFFPMYLIGYHLSKEQIKKLFSVKWRITAFVIITVVFAESYLHPDISDKWLLGSKPYAELGNPDILSMFTRLGVYTVSMIMVFSFLAFVPRGKHFFSRWGAQTLYVYLLHGFFVRIFRESRIHTYFTSTESFIMLAGFALLITILLSSQIIESLAQPIIELKISKFKKLFYTVLKRLKAIKSRSQSHSSSLR